MRCRLEGSSLEVYGLTQNEENEYLMVLQYANKGNLHKYLRSNFNSLKWESKLQQLICVSYDLARIHRAGYTHNDLHPGNILQNQFIRKIRSYIADLGLSRMKNNNIPEVCIYGVMPYVAPEVYSEKKYTSPADIFSFGVIMAEMSTGIRPFDGYEFDFKLAVKIYEGEQPVFASGTPDCYIKLAQQCMNLDPYKRPTAKDICLELTQWQNILRDFATLGCDKDEALYIKKEFLKADEIIKELQIPHPKHPD